jgi:NitT/TauT family transport system ATP-binding protein
MNPRVRSSDATIQLIDVTLSFTAPDGTTLTTIRDLSLTVGRGEFVAVVGPTGAGKSTTLNLVTGLLRPDKGEVRVFGAQVTGVDPRVGFVFQSDALFPWRNVLNNVAAGPIFRGMKKAQAHKLARAWIERVGLKGFENHYPHQLSGGMRKRAALAQTFINEPQILLMDEPFSSLDVQTRLVMHEELLSLWESTGSSVIFVTHDIDEAVTLADRVCVLTKRPATVKSQYAVDLPRPRSAADIRFDPRFIELSRMIWEDLRSEVRTASVSSIAS